MRATLHLYNTLTREVEAFEPIDQAGRTVAFYSCGPTVYDFAHIGNFRSFLNADLLRRTLELLDYTVRHVMNMTDVGHMTEDDIADGGGEDKMAEAARRIREARASSPSLSGRGSGGGSIARNGPEAAPTPQPPPVQGGGVADVPHDDLPDPNDPYAIAEFYIRAFQRDAKLLGIKVVQEAERDPSLLPRPTQYVEQMKALIETLIAKNHAYVARDGAVYFDVQSFPKYGQLSGNTLDKLRAGEGGRVSAANQAVKKHPADFLLWKRDPAHLMRWPSPWGEGYPGWHLECSAMARALLGEEIDIHSGGEDNIFPHHECEIAQTCSATGRPTFARYWFHTRHLMVEGEKMSKSKGNFYTVSDLLSRGASPAAIRLALIGTHYRTNANFTMQGLKDAQRRIYRWIAARIQLQSFASSEVPATIRPFSTSLEKFKSALCNDLEISAAIATMDDARNQLTEFVESHGQPTQAAGTSVVNRAWVEETECFDAMWTALLGTAAASVEDDSAAEALRRARDEARQRRDFAKADSIRKFLRDLGYEIEDKPEGPSVLRKVAK